MIKKILVAFLFCLASTIANANAFKVNRELECNTLSEIAKILNEFDEKYVWQGKNSQKLQTMLVVNTKSQTWTLVMTDGQLACVLDSGEGFLLPGQSEKKSEVKPQADKKKDSKNLVDINFVQ